MTSKSDSLACTLIWGSYFIYMSLNFYIYKHPHCRITTVSFKQNNVGKARGTVPGATQKFSQFQPSDRYCLVGQQAQKDDSDNC